MLAEGNTGTPHGGAAVSPFTATRGYAILKGVLSGLLLFVMGIGVLALVYHGSGGGWAAAPWAGGYFRPTALGARRPPWRSGDPHNARRRLPPRGRRPRRRRSRLGPTTATDDGSDHQSHPEVELALPREPFRDRAVVEVEPSDATEDHPRELA